MATSRRSSAGTKGVPRPERESQILHAAVDEFGLRGYAAASMVSIAERVGVSKPLLYQYFGSKDGVYLAALEYVSLPLTAEIARALASGVTTPRTPLAVLRAIFTSLEGRRHAWFVLYDRTLPASGELRAAVEQHRDAIDRLAADGSAQLLAEHDDPLDSDALKQAWTGTVNALVTWWINHPEQSAQDMAERCERLFAAALV